MPTLLPDPFDDWSALLDDALMAAITSWLKTIHPDLYPTLLAAGEDELTPNLEALLSSIAAWELAVNEEAMPLLVGLVARRMVDMAEARGLTVEELVTGTAATGSAAVALTAAIDQLKAAGIPTASLPLVLKVPSWMDFIESYMTTTVNLVVGMPEMAYRDLVTKLGQATMDGMAPWERARLAREFLDMSTEGGYEQWMTRAHRISRTETNRAINAADLQAAKTEEAVTGQPLEKVWVATLDPRTRDTHFAADGQRVPLDGKFLLGGHECDHPGDPNLPAHLSVNCRCTTIILDPADPMPGETDRQTERERSDGTTRDPQAEVRARAKQGVTRARDSEPETVTAAAKEHTMRTTFSGVLAPIGTSTGDGRVFDKDAALTFREFPLPLLFQRATSDGHDTAVVVGKITSATVEAEAIHAVGEFLDTPEAAEAKSLVAEELIRPSVDLADMQTSWEVTDAEGNPVDPEVDDWEEGWKEVMHVQAAQIIAATLVSKPAFAEAKIILGEDTPAPADSEQEVQALTAAAGLLTQAPAAAFQDPQLDGPTALTVTEEGKVYGHLALWGTEHVAMPGRAITPPKSRMDYALFHVSTLHTDQGPISCGRLTVGCGHASTTDRAEAATAHYDQAGTTWAYVRAGEDAHGIWVAGVVNPDAEAASIRAGAAAPLSGDWRSVGGTLELVAALSVNTPGFPVPRAFSQVQGQQLSLVAAGALPRAQVAHQAALAQAVADGIRMHEERKADQEASQKRAHKSRLLAAQMMAQQVKP